MYNHKSFIRLTTDSQNLIDKTQSFTVKVKIQNFIGKIQSLKVKLKIESPRLIFEQSFRTNYVIEDVLSDVAVDSWQRIVQLKKSFKRVSLAVKQIKDSLLASFVVK